jgi:hypothetical protein
VTEQPAEQSAEAPAEQPAAPASARPAPAVDPMKGFRGVMAGTLVLEVIVVALSLLVVAKLYGGLGTGTGAVVGAVIVLLLATCWLLRRSWSVVLVWLAQAALICCFPGSAAVGAIGVLFALIWGVLLWMRWDVGRRMAAGRLPSQRPSGHSE